MFEVLSSWNSHCLRSTVLGSQDNQLEPIGPPKLSAVVTAFTIAIHSLLLSQNADTQFTVLHSVEG